MQSYSRYPSSVLFHCLHFSQLTLQTAIFGFHKIDNDTSNSKSHITFTQITYIQWKYGFLSFNNFLNEISRIKNLERRLAVKRNKCERFRKKWHRMENKVP